MNVNFGLFPDIEEPATDSDGNRVKGKERGRERKRALSRRALADLSGWLKNVQQAAE
jgi:methylenetetrahydrofolate--tRNA-(uracil-5-)-methyltransferase